MKLIFDGEAAQYHPATGLLLTPGEADYPDDRAEALIALGLRKPSTPPRAKAPAREGKE